MTRVSPDLIEALLRSSLMLHHSVEFRADDESVDFAIESRPPIPGGARW